MAREQVFFFWGGRTYFHCTLRRKTFEKEMPASTFRLPRLEADECAISVWETRAGGPQLQCSMDGSKTLFPKR